MADEGHPAQGHHREPFRLGPWLAESWLGLLVVPTIFGAIAGMGVMAWIVSS